MLEAWIVYSTGTNDVVSLQSAISMGESLSCTMSILRLRYNCARAIHVDLVDMAQWILTMQVQRSIESAIM